MFVQLQEGDKVPTRKGLEGVLEPEAAAHNKSVLKIFAKFAGKQLYQSLFLISLQCSNLQLY